jgi:dienelactone hydrolase
MNTLFSFIKSLAKYMVFAIIVICFTSGNAWAELPEVLGPYKIGFQQVVMIDTTRDTNQINKPGEPNGRRIVVSIYYPLDLQIAKKGIPVQYKFDYAGDVNPSGSLPLATARANNGNLTFPSYFGALVDKTSVLPKDSSIENCNVQNCTDGTIVGLPVSKLGPFPLVVVAHGGQGSGIQFSSLGEYLASYGYVVAAPAVTGFRGADFVVGPCAPGQQRPCLGTSTNARAFDLSFVITQMIAKNNASADPFYKKINANKIGAWGYSAGATAVQQIVAGTTAGGVPVPKDTRVDAFVAGGVGALNATTTLAANVTVPSLWLTGTADENRTVALTASYNLVSTANAKAKYLLTIAGMPHIGTHITTCDRFQRILDLQNNGNITPSDVFLYSLYFTFDGAKFGGLQAFCPSSQFYDASNYAALTTFGLTSSLLLESQIPGRINLATVYEPSTLAATSEPIVDIMSLAFFEVHLKNNFLYGILLIPSIANSLDSHISLQGCIQSGASTVCAP